MTSYELCSWDFLIIRELADSFLVSITELFKRVVWWTVLLFIHRIAHKSHSVYVAWSICYLSEGLWEKNWKDTSWDLKGHCLSVVGLEAVFFCILMFSPSLFPHSLRMWRRSKKLDFHSCPAITTIPRNCVLVQTVSRSWGKAKKNQSHLVCWKKGNHPPPIKPLTISRNFLRLLLSRY